MDKEVYYLAFWILIIVLFDAMSELRRFIRNRKRRAYLSILLSVYSVYLCVCLIVSYLNSFSVNMNLSILGLGALLIILIPWVFIRLRVK